MKHRKDGCKIRQEHDKRRYPFTESTRLIELVEKRHYGDVVKLTERLRPYLIDEGKGPFELTGLFFDLEAIKGQRQFIISELALFLQGSRGVCQGEGVRNVCVLRSRQAGLPVIPG